MTFPEGSQGMLISKGVAILADLPITSAAKVVNRFCGSSMDAVHQVSQSINSGDTVAGIAAGVEDMFQVPMGDLIQVSIQIYMKKSIM